MFCCTLLYVHSSIAIILMGKRKLVAMLNLSSSCFVMVERFFLAVSWGCLWFVIVVFPGHTHLLFFVRIRGKIDKNSLFGKALVSIRAKIAKKHTFWYGFGYNNDKIEKNTLFDTVESLSLLYLLVRLARR